MKKIIETLQRKWVEYLLEIFVITIGILGAFALNSWNQARSNNEFQLNALKGLLQEFTNNQVELERQQKLKREVLDWNRIYLEKLKTNAATSDDVSKFLGELGARTFNPSNGVLNSLIYSGDIGKIRNDSLRYALTSWPDILADYQEEDLYHIEGFGMYVIDADADHIIPRSSYPHWSEEEKNETYSSFSTTIQHFNHVIENIHFLEVELDEAERLQNSIHLILKLLQVEIDNLE